MNDIIKQILGACDSATGEPVKLRQVRKTLIALIPAAIKTNISPEVMTVFSASIPALSGGSSQPDQQKAMKLAIKQLAAGIRAALRGDPAPVFIDASDPPPRIHTAASPSPASATSAPPPPAPAPTSSPALAAWDVACEHLEAVLPRAECSSPSRSMLRAATEAELRNHFAANAAARIAEAVQTQLSPTDSLSAP